jgi:hypothetical protein
MSAIPATDSCCSAGGFPCFPLACSRSGLNVVEGLVKKALELPAG